MLNKQITSLLESRFRNLTLTTDIGKFLADKSYGFDTVFFAARFINRFRFGNEYHKIDMTEKSNAYFADLFCLTPGSAQVPNYMTEAVALLCFAHILQKENNNNYIIIDEELLDFISSSLEHAYIFEYMLCYCVFKHDGIWDLYKKFCSSSTLDEKQKVYLSIREEFVKKDSRIKDPNKEWANFIPKYPTIVLGYVNRSNMVSRTTTVQENIVTIEDIALNVTGTRANYSLPKKNSYLDDFSNSYVVETLRPYLALDREMFDRIDYSDSFSIDVADVKLDMLDDDNSTWERKRKMQGSKYKISGGVKTRTVQGEFRGGLLRLLPHRCPVCGFEYESFLIASHIRPYAKCEDTYDAMNPQNGFLMCPICDKLFESANYITIDYKSGDVVYDPKIENEKDFQYLHGRTIDVNYIDCERKHYLKWHNEEYSRKHAL